MVSYIGKMKGNLTVGWPLIRDFFFNFFSFFFQPFLEFYKEGGGGHTYRPTKRGVSGRFHLRVRQKSSPHGMREQGSGRREYMQDVTQRMAQPIK